MPADITVLMENRPGALADIAEALGQAGVNIEGMCGFVTGGRGRRPSPRPGPGGRPSGAERGL